MNKFDFIAIGDITTDAFIRIKDASVHCNLKQEECELCLAFGEKVPYEFVKVIRAVGNSANAAVSAARLGLRSALIADVGDDQNGKECLGSLRDSQVETDYVRLHSGMESNYHYVLWYDVERTILVKHQPFPYKMPELKEAPGWMYLSSVGHDSLEYHKEITSYIKEHSETKLVFQPGTFQMQLGKDTLSDIYKRTEIFVCNVQEAQKILATHDEDLKNLMKGLAALGPKLVSVTDGIKGAYLYDGTDSWFMPVYPQDPYERTGAGDAFASTFTVAIALGKSPEEALMWGPINSASVVQYIGAQEGLLSQEELLKRLNNAPADYKPKKI